MTFSEEEKNRIIKSLLDRLDKLDQSLVCSVCKCNDFILADGYLRDTLQRNMQDYLVFGGKGIPQIAVICNSCGFILRFSSGILGIMEEKEKSNVPS